MTALIFSLTSPHIIVAHVRVARSASVCACMIPIWRALQRRLGTVAAHGGVHSAAQLLCMVVVVRLSALKLRGSVADGIVARPRRGIAGKTPLRFTGAAKCSTLPRTWPYPTSRPAPPRTRRAHGTILRVFRDIPELERRSGDRCWRVSAHELCRHRTRPTCPDCLLGECQLSNAESLISVGQNPYMPLHPHPPYPSPPPLPFRAVPHPLHLPHPESTSCSLSYHHHHHHYVLLLLLLLLVIISVSSPSH
jgi:hypothetical protein